MRILNSIGSLGLITGNRVRRLIYYLRNGRLDIVISRIRRLWRAGVAAPIKLSTLSGEIEGPIVIPRHDAPLVSIIIPVYNNFKTTISCLASIKENTDSVSYEVIVADDASKDETLRLQDKVRNITQVVNKTNLGFIRNCNNGARYGKGKYLVFLNNDTNVQPGWLKHLVTTIEQDSTVGLVGSMLLYPNGRLQEAGGIIWSDGSGWNYGRHDYPERPEYNYLKEVDYISGACILVPRALWERVGGFDERFIPAYYEDTDLAFAVRQLGCRVLYQPLSRVIHLEGVSHGKDISSGVKAYQETNQRKFVDKWRAALKADHYCGPRDLFRARDRSHSKKTLLYIDHYVPMHDQDAGSRSTFQYLELMVDIGYRIVFIGDNFVAHQPYTTMLQQMGIEVLYSSWYRRNWKNWLKKNGEYIDYAYVSRPHIATRYIKHLKKFTKAKLVYCGHDLHYLREQRHYQVSGNSAHLKSSEKWRRTEIDILQEVDNGYFFSDVEVEELKKVLPDKTVRVIPLFLYEDEELELGSSVLACDRSGLLFVGGFMHEPNIDGIIWFVQEILPLIRRRLPDVTLTVVGSNPPKEIAILAQNGVVITGYISEEQLLQHYARTRVVVAPLRFGAGIKGKVVEAMRYGVPTVTTSIGAEGIGNDENTLLIADDAESFADEVIGVYGDQESWEEVSGRLHETAIRSFSKTTARSILCEDMPL